MLLELHRWVSLQAPGQHVSLAEVSFTLREDREGLNCAKCHNILDKSARMFANVSGQGWKGDTQQSTLTSWPSSCARALAVSSLREKMQNTVPREQGCCDSNQIHLEWLLNRSSPILDWL
jgi:hypothetical protein